MKNIAKDILHLLKFGKLSDKNFGNVDVIYKFIIIVIILELLRMFISILTYFFFHLFNVEIPQNSNLKLFDENGLGYLLVMGSVLAPIIEESAFRLCLKYSPLNFALMIGSWFYLELNSSIFNITMLSINYPKINKLLIALLISSSVYGILRKQKKVDRVFKAFWLAYPRIILYGLLFSFSFSHILNYEFTFRILLMIPLLTLPQAIAGIGLSYARLKFDLLLSIIIHSISNLIFILIVS